MKPDAFMHTAPAEPRTCPICYTTHMAATSISLNSEDRTPRLAVDAITVCSACGTVLRVTTLGFRVVDDAEIDTLEPTLRRLVRELAGWCHAQQERRRP